MNPNDISSKIEQVTGQELDEGQRYEIALWQRGRTLGSIAPHAREEIQNMLEEYVRTDADALLAVEPQETAEVLAKHAIAHASARTLVRFVGDINTALEAAMHTPETVKTGLRQVSEL